jgi:hypothetical protein
VCLLLGVLYIYPYKAFDLETRRVYVTMDAEDLWGDEVRMNESVAVVAHTIASSE